MINLKNSLSHPHTDLLDYLKYLLILQIVNIQEIKLLLFEAVET